MMKKNKKTDKAEDKNVNEDVNKTAEDIESQTSEQTKEGGSVLSEVQKLEEEYRQLEEKFKRLSADYANYQKRVPRQIEESIAYRVESFVKSLLPGIDNFDHALAHADSCDKESMKKGVEMVYDNLIAILKNHGLEQIDAAGKEFDHHCHQAVMQKADEQQENGIVLEQYQKGYKYKDRVIRPAMVVVNKLPEDTVDQEHPEESPESGDSDQQRNDEQNQETETEK
jgi:molecular chaperone GrpE